MAKLKKARKRAMIQGGNEKKMPDFEKLVEGHEDYQRELNTGFNYASYMFDGKDCKLFATEYAKEHLDITFPNVPDWEFRHLGACCWLLSSGAWLKDVEAIHERLKALPAKYKKDDKPKVKVDLTSVRTGHVIGELEGLIDDVILRKENIQNPSDIYKQFGTGFNISEVKAHFQAQIDDIDIGGEGYDDNPDTPLVRKVLCLILEQLEDQKEVVKEKKVRKTVRRAKTKKIVPAKMIRKLKYKRTDDEYKIKSVPAVKIVMADALWVFNTKTRKMMHYVAQDKVGLLVKGTSIQNYDKEKSQEKKLRKPEEFLTALADAGKVAQRTLLDDINAKGKVPNGRINEHCVLVKVY